MIQQGMSSHSSAIAFSAIAFVNVYVFGLDSKFISKNKTYVCMTTKMSLQYIYEFKLMFFLNFVLSYKNY